MEHLRLLELNQLIRSTLDNNLEPSYWVVAEVAELRLNQKGHCYLDLIEKEDDRLVARIRATIWAYTFRGLSAWFESITGKPLQNGMTVLCNVSVEYHELYGMSLNIREIDPRFTLGERARKRQEIIERLTREGVVDMNKSVALPVAPLRIAVISSPTAAGFGDFSDQLKNNLYGYAFRTRLFKAVMQGDEAPPSIIDALNRIHNSINSFDVVVIIRGGGAQVDLDCFDTYDLANHVAQFPLPVLTGIGHERDETILDLVAHTRLKTPTAVAEFLIGGVRSYEERMINHFETIAYHAQQRLKYENQRLKNLEYRLKSGVRKVTSQQDLLLEKRSGQLKAAARKFLSMKMERLRIASKSLELVHPDNILKRGYTLTTLNGKSIHQVELKEGDTITTYTINKKINSQITTINNNKNE
ncbi:exodeoxyribonuclease VII large subunit [Fulvivirga sedimenti]|uniref:Exodeoxyribonuclease 7 large subunit n=1 Tax=Fulvivirga sedimenti TaxID=2879465 RepID=A0A9X1KY16_9BACT|nr:exodeoxyribonuclease VII large subunit [Fulvivirga sedimenti]MCA6074777.1 exodeoxyribonuclease VII large subunit [Fulvivirga sedimenti]MCA6075954.1 exodeoxyribonuclease VII large subunit [Fulvivirga sedimenti]MCA6077082.1 exodeoxyribonuclease VII large subunit [Fulvivirga sedimenti]